MSRHAQVVATHRALRRVAYAAPLQRAQELRATWTKGRQMSLAKVAAQLSAEGFRAPNGGRWTPIGVSRLLALGAE